MCPLQEVDVGLAADIGTLARLPKITGNQSLASELAFTARPFGVSEALAVGLISRAVDGGRDEVVKAALDTAALIAEKSPIAVLGTKRLLLHARDHSYVLSLRAFWICTDWWTGSTRLVCTRTGTVWQRTWSTQRCGTALCSRRRCDALWSMGLANSSAPCSVRPG